MNVLLWSPKGAGLHYGGAGMAAFRLYAESRPQDCTVSLAHGLSRQKLHPAVFASQYYISELGGGASLRGRDRYLKGVWAKGEQLRFLRNSQKWTKAHIKDFSILHGLGAYELTVYAATRAEQLGVPAVVKVGAHRGDLARKSTISSWTGLVDRRRRQVAALTAVIATTEAVAQELREYGVPEKKIALIPNGVDEQVFRPVGSRVEQIRLRSVLGLGDLPTVIFSGSIVRRKRPHLLVEALAIARERGVDCQLLLVGPEHDRTYAQGIRSSIEAFKLQERVYWTGFVENVAELYRVADVYCLLSAQEGMSNSVLEATASGIPVVASQAAAAAGLVEEGKNGSVIIEATPEAIAQAVVGYARNPAMARAQGAEGRQRMLRRYALGRTRELHWRLFEGVLNGRHAAELAPLTKM